MIIQREFSYFYIESNTQRLLHYLIHSHYILTNLSLIGIPFIVFCHNLFSGFSVAQNYFQYSCKLLFVCIFYENLNTSNQLIPFSFINIPYHYYHLLVIILLLFFCTKQANFCAKSKVLFTHSQHNIITLHSKKGKTAQ